MTVRMNPDDAGAQPIILNNGRLITPFRVIPRGGVVIRNGKIARILEGAECDAPEQGAAMIDVGRRLIVPGFIDLHVHGGGGADLMDDDPTAIAVITRTHALGGTTALVPSTVTSSMADLRQALDNVGRAKAEAAKSPAACGAHILGVHLEGPYFSAEQKGAQDARYLKKPAPEEYLELLAGHPEIIRLSAAPELDGALRMGRELSSRGILVSIGHSDATYDQVLAALEAGFSHVTHLYSGMSGVRRINAYRVAGVIESALLLDELTVEIIADGRHLPASLIKLIYKCKGAGRIALVTDAIRAAGMPEGEYFLGNRGSGQKFIVEDGVAKLPDRRAFAGSVATMNLMVKNAVELGEISLREAVEMATSTPARILGCGLAKGSLAPGKDADVVVMEEGSYAVKLTMVGGRIAHNSLPGSRK